MAKITEIQAKAIYAQLKGTINNCIKENAWEFYTTRQRYVWKGWCFDNGESSKR